VSAAPRRGALPLAALAALGLAALGAATLLPAPDAAGQVRARRTDRDRDRDRPASFNRGWDIIDDYNQTILRMQRERIASDEERAREAGRERRRNEVEAQREKDAAAHEAYFSAVIEASRAALRAPRGAYYRRPGFISTDPPGADATAVTVGGITYLYEQGIFWLRQGDRYTVVTAPPGAVVPTLPEAAYPVPSADGVLSYYFGTFFRAAEGGYTVVVPPAGVVVSYVPDGYERETAGGKTIYRFGAVAFRPVFVHGILSYRVAAP